MPRTVINYEQIFASVTCDSRYCRNLDWGRPRRGHPEGTIRAHIDELEQNLDRLRHRLSDEEVWKLRILIHVHDTFKPDAKPGVPIWNVQSHASIASRFLVELCGQHEMAVIVQFHDEPYALFRQHRSTGEFDQNRFQELLSQIEDWDLFVAFLIIDGCTRGKARDPLHWFLNQISGLVDSRWTISDLL